jgi:hypothetical protein
MRAPSSTAGLLMIYADKRYTLYPPSTAGLLNEYVVFKIQTVKEPCTLLPPHPLASPPLPTLLYAACHLFKDL